MSLYQKIFNDNNVSNSMTIYEPQEDSYMLAEAVRKHAFGNVLDMGCGSGIQGTAALEVKKVRSVVFSDINKEAIHYVKTNIKRYSDKQCKLIISDLFSNIKGSYDTIFFNPPYLPDDENDNEKLITTGGLKGHEVICKFLLYAKEYLNDNGIILIVFSSLGNKDKIIGMIDRYYDKELLDQKSFFMEKLYVYKLKRKPLIFKGQRGRVEVVTIKKFKVVIKTALKDYNAANEAKFLTTLNKHGIGPKLITYDKNKNSLQMEYIDGIPIEEYFEYSSKSETLQIIKKILKQIYQMDILHMNKFELTNPYKHIIIRDHEPVMIDFERCRMTEKPKNITQFIQYLSSGRIKRILEDKSIKVDSMKDIANKYKSNINKNKNIIDQIMQNIR